MSDAAAAYEGLMAKFSSDAAVSAGQMFGKACLKIQGKAFVALHQETVVFKLAGVAHQKALSLAGAALWDPSGKGRAMKEWVAVPASQGKHFGDLAEAALAYVLP